MSESAASLRRKIEGARDLQSVVRSMKALASSSIGQYERSVRALDDYYRTVELGLGACLRGAASTPLHGEPNTTARKGPVGAIVFGSDQGLVGQFNEVVANHAMTSIAAFDGNTRVWAVGERLHARLADAAVPVMKIFSVPSSVDAIVPLVGELLMETEGPRGDGAVTELHLFYNHATPAGGYAPVAERLLPLDEAWRRKLVAPPWPTRSLPEVIGSRSTTLRALIREHIFVSLFRACAESLASENASRLAAMERADKNIDELLESFESTFHRLRQESIDEELFDLIRGSARG